LLDSGILDVAMAYGNKGVDGGGGLHLNELQHACITENYKVAKMILT
jgi:hypothetical protein